MAGNEPKLVETRGFTTRLGSNSQKTSAVHLCYDLPTAEWLSGGVWGGATPPQRKNSERKALELEKIVGKCFVERNI